jgi:hypothetical protein
MPHAHVFVDAVFHLLMYSFMCSYGSTRLNKIQRGDGKVYPVAHTCQYLSF